MFERRAMVDVNQSERRTVPGEFKCLFLIIKHIINYGSG